MRLKETRRKRERSKRGKTRIKKEIAIIINDSINTLQKTGLRENRKEEIKDVF